MFNDLGPEGTAALITTIGVVIAGIVSFLGARYAAKQSALVGRDETSVSGKNADINSWDKLVTSLQNELGRLNKRVESLETQGEEDRNRISALETQLRDGDVKYRVALQYIHDVIVWTKSLLNTTSVPPDAPPLIASDLEMH